MNRLLVLLSLLLFASASYSQIDSAEVYRQLFEEDEYIEPLEEEEEEKEGIAVFLSLRSRTLTSVPAFTLFNTLLLV